MMTAKTTGLIYVWLLVSLTDIGQSLSSLAVDSVCSVCSHTAVVRCVNRSLLEVPASLPADTRTLNLSYNVITQLTAEQIGYLSLVEVVSLEHNQLSSVSDSAFLSCPALRSLYLDHNVLSSVSFLIGTQLQELHVSCNRISVLETGNSVLPLTTLDLSFNSLQQFNASSLSSLQNVRLLNLSHNHIEAVLLDDASVLSSSSLSQLDIASNKLATVTLCADCYCYSLQYVNLSSNRLRSVDCSWCQLWPYLLELRVSDNPVSSLVAGTFRHCSSLHTLDLSQLHIHHLATGTFTGLTSLRTLKLHDNHQLVSVEQHVFRGLSELVELDLSGCSLMTLPLGTFKHLRPLVVELADNPWHCHCELLDQLSVHVQLSLEDTVCVEPVSVRGASVFNVSQQCHVARPHTDRQTVWTHVGAELIVDCNATGDDPLNVTWFKLKHSDHVLALPSVHDTAAVHFDDNDRVHQLLPASLYVASVSRATAGLYYCIASNEFGSGTMVLSVRLSSDAISLITLHSIIIGLLSAAAFFLVAVGIARYLAYVCSRKERRKRKSIRAVLESIQDYKCAQFDRFSAYRTAKMDQLSAFKSAKIEQLSAFRDARVDRLRTYKQATVASILTHLERMREHYSAQTARIKDNCAVQAERLRERYSARRGRFKDYRSHQVDKMRENYTAQAARIREYGMIQMSRLREQYKTQQQHVLKLVELLDVGSCVSGVIEAECMKAESMIFDADIAFDFEAQPAHAHTECHSDEAASDSDLSLASVTCVVDVIDDVVDDVNDDVVEQMELDERLSECPRVLSVVNEQQQQQTDIDHASTQ